VNTKNSQISLLSLEHEYGEYQKISHNCQRLPLVAEAKIENGSAADMIFWAGNG
jgi:hypothetical protein